MVGIDEAGRGPLAGPVAVGAVVCGVGFDMKLLAGVRDSKKLSERQREEWFAKLKGWKKAKKLDYRVSLVGASVIDSKGIAHAIRKGVSNCLKRLGIDEARADIKLDGSLKAPKKFLLQTTIIGGDDKVPLISLASIAAKVIRDRKMKRLTERYPEYRFDVHKGYGTRLHIELIRKLGPSPIHRQSFLTRIA